MGIHYLYFRYITISARKPLRAESIHIVFAPIKYHPESLLPPYHTYHTYLYHYTPTAPTVPTSTTTNYYRTTLLLAIVYEQQTAAFLLAKARHTPKVSPNRISKPQIHILRICRCVSGVGLGLGLKDLACKARQVLDQPRSQTHSIQKPYTQYMNPRFCTCVNRLE